MLVRSRPTPFSSFFAEQAPPVAAFLRGMLPRDAVEECLQETFLAALSAYDGFDGANPRAWVLTIARRKAIDAHRARARRPQLDPESDVEVATASQGSPETELEGEIWIEVAALPEKQRAALVLRYALDLRHREIGAALGCSEAAARRSVHEGLSRLRQTRLEEAVR